MKLYREKYGCADVVNHRQTLFVTGLTGINYKTFKTSWLFRRLRWMKLPNKLAARNHQLFSPLFCIGSLKPDNHGTFISPLIYKPQPRVCDPVTADNPSEYIWSVCFDWGSLRIILSGFDCFWTAPPPTSGVSRWPADSLIRSIVPSQVLPHWHCNQHFVQLYEMRIILFPASTQQDPLR